MQVEALEDLLEMMWMWISGESCKKQETKEGDIFLRLSGSNDMSFFVAEWSRWDKYKRAPWRQDSSASSRDGGGKQAWDSLRNR